MKLEIDTPAICLRAPKMSEFDWIVERASALAMRNVRHRSECETHAAVVVADYLMSPDPWSDICLVAECDGEKVGAGIVLGKTARNAELAVFFVDCVPRRKEIGACLINACMAFASGPRYESLSCTTLLFPECAEPFLTRFGFEEEAPGHEWRRQL